jgi:hypothetical protein
VCVARVCRRSEPVRLSAAGCSSSSRPIAAARLHEPQLAADDTCATATTTATTITTRFLRITTTTANALPPLLKIKNRVDTLHGNPYAHAHNIQRASGTVHPGRTQPMQSVCPPRVNSARLSDRFACSSRLTTARLPRPSPAPPAPPPSPSRAPPSWVRWRARPRRA